MTDSRAHAHHLARARHTSHATNRRTPPTSPHHHHRLHATSDNPHPRCRQHRRLPRLPTALTPQPHPPITLLLRPPSSRPSPAKKPSPPYPAPHNPHHHQLPRRVLLPRLHAYPIDALIIATKAQHTTQALAPSSTASLLQPPPPPNRPPPAIPNVNACFAGITNYNVRARAPFDLVLSALSGKLVFGRIDGLPRGIAPEGSVEAHH